MDMGGASFSMCFMVITSQWAAVALSPPELFMVSSPFPEACGMMSEDVVKFENTDVHVSAYCVRWRTSDRLLLNVCRSISRLLSASVSRLLT